MSFRVLTLNLWNINEPVDARFSALVRGLGLLRPDIVCLQEVSRHPKLACSQSELIAEICKFPYSAECDGLSIVCRYPVVGSGSAALPEFPGDWPREVLFAELLIDGRQLLVANTHLAYPPEMVHERKQQAEALLKAMKRCRASDAGKTKILCGDFNDVPDSAAVRAVLESQENFYDVFDKCSPNNPGITYSRQNPYVDPSTTVDQRIDYIFASRDLVARDCNVVFDGNEDLDFVSDHFGVFCTLSFL